MKLSKTTVQTIKHFIGLENNRTGHLEKWVSASGGLFGILAIILISQQFLGVQQASWVVASMGATAVLIFAVPHGLLSQPWPVIGGHVVSAIVGVSCARWIPSPLLAAAVAVAVAIAVMHYLRCIHPPGGATALTAVIGGSDIQELGFHYVMTPVLLNAVVIVIIAMIFNYAFHWRRYPVALAVKHSSEIAAPEHAEDSLDEADLETALQVMGSTIDISSEDLADIYRLARQNKLRNRISPAQLKSGCYYSNGLYGNDWQVRQIVDMASAVTSPENLLIYRVVAGSGRRSTGSISVEAFARWASYEVMLNENSWQRKQAISDVSGKN